MTSTEASKEENELATGQSWESRLQEYQPSLADLRLREWRTPGECGGASGETGREACGARETTTL